MTAVILLMAGCGSKTSDVPDIQEPTGGITVEEVKPAEDFSDEADVTSQDEKAENQTEYTDDEICQLALDYCENTTGFRPPLAEIDSQEGNTVNIHLYENMEDHTATVDWYYLDRETLKGTNILGEEISLLGDVLEKTYRQVSMDDAISIMESEEGYIILDVRTEEEYSSGHIPGAVCLPNETIADTMPESLPDKEQVILVYCRSGNRSKQAAQKLADMGYTNIVEFGGIIDWPGEIVY